MDQKNYTFIAHWKHMKTFTLFLLSSCIITSHLHAMQRPYAPPAYMEKPSAPPAYPTYDILPPAYNAPDLLTPLQEAVAACDPNALTTLLNEGSALVLKDQKNAQLAANIYAIGLVRTNVNLQEALKNHNIPIPNKDFLTLLTRDILKLHGRWSIEDLSTKKLDHIYPIEALEWCLNNGADVNGVTQGAETKTPGFPYQYQQPDKTTNTHPLGILLEIQAVPCHMKAIIQAYELFKKRGATLSDKQALKVLDYWQSSPANLGGTRCPDHRMGMITSQAMSCTFHQGSYSASECNAFNLIKAAYIILLDKKDLNISTNTSSAIRSALQNYSSFSNPKIQYYLKPIVHDTSANNPPSSPTSFFSRLALRLRPTQSASRVEPIANTYDDLCNLPPYQEKPQYFIMD